MKAGCICASLALAACAGAEGPPRRAPDPPRVQAALAVVTVDNRTTAPLSIEFRPAGRQRGRVGIGSVPAGTMRRLAPVPATEPIVLHARTPQGGTLELPARTFAVDEQWLWVIPAETVFR